MVILLLVAVFVVLLQGAAADSTNICSQNRTIGHAIIAAMNLSYPGLEPVAKAVALGNYGDACEALAYYYETCSSGNWLRYPPVTPGTGRAGGLADQALQDIFFLGGVDETAKIPRNPDGGLDWLDKGPREDVEFMNCLNRHPFFDVLLDAWNATGNPVYAAKINDLVIDWVLHLPCNPCVTGISCFIFSLLVTVLTPGTMESPWRTLEIGIRAVDPWPRAFYGLQRVAAFNVSVSPIPCIVVCTSSPAHHH
jgi:hypothetical protein